MHVGSKICLCLSDLSWLIAIELFKGYSIDWQNAIATVPAAFNAPHCSRRNPQAMRQRLAIPPIPPDDNGLTWLLA